MPDSIERFAKEHALSDDQTEALTRWAASRVPLTFDDPEQAAASGDLPAGMVSVHLDGDPTSDGRTLGRFDDLGPIGAGGMGEVRRVRDPHLNRVMALKVMRADRRDHPAAVARFTAEIQVTAQLQHPGIVPVHEVGRLPSGQIYYTMKEVRGRTLTYVLQEVHRANRGEAHWVPAPSGWTLRRLLEAMRQVTEAMAYAHHRGVVHRDLKPDNIMLGDFGEVYVLDWGLAKVMDAPSDDRPIHTERTGSHVPGTRHGAVTGTPQYMPPEQALGQIDRIGPTADVYALGAMLYEVLAGQCPYADVGYDDIVDRVINGPPRPVTDIWSGPDLPPEVVALCERSMARQPGDRFDTAAGVAAALAHWLDGAQRRDRALEVLEQARRATVEGVAHRRRAASLRAQARAHLRDIPKWETEDKKAAGWALEGEAAAAEHSAALAELEADGLEQSAFSHVEDLPEAHLAQAERYRTAHEAAERERDAAAALRSEQLLRKHAEALPARHPARIRHLAYLEGDGALTLVTDPPGAEVLLHRYEPLHRRLIPVFERSLGSTPLVKTPLPQGSYLCVLRHPACAEVRYPVQIARNAHWDGVRPGSESPHPIQLTSVLADEDCYVPAGWFWCGGDGHRSYALRRVWCDAFVMRRFPVTNRRYMAFLTDLVASGREDEALRYVPRERSGTAGAQGSMIYGRTADGGFHLRPDADGDLWELDWPVINVDWNCASAYARWMADRTGDPWRLPGDLEWEKAARGVDGRARVWGDDFDPCYCRMAISRPDSGLPAVVDSFPIDESAYGVRGLGGNVQDWCLEPFTLERAPPTIVGNPGPGASTTDEPHRICRGGFWTGTASDTRLLNRFNLPPGYRTGSVGFRLVRPLFPT